MTREALGENLSLHHTAPFWYLCVKVWSNWDDLRTYQNRDTVPWSFTAQRFLLFTYFEWGSWRKGPIITNEFGAGEKHQMGRHRGWSSFIHRLKQNTSLCGLIPDTTRSTDYLSLQTCTISASLISVFTFQHPSLLVGISQPHRDFSFLGYFKKERDGMKLGRRHV